MGVTALTTLDAALKGVTAIGLDTSPYIYLIEHRLRSTEVMREIFRRITSGAIMGYTSTITMTELLTKPLQVADTTLANRYRMLLLHSKNFSMLPVDAVIADTAAAVRARYGLRTPDSLQIATAIDANCDAFLTNDRALRRVTEIAVIVLDDLTL